MDWLWYTVIVIIVLFIVNETTDVFTTLISILISITLLYFVKSDVLGHKEHKEHYVDSSGGESVTQLDKILQLLGSQNTSLSAQDITNSKKSNNNESIDKIMNGLTVYYTAFNTRSFPKNAKTLYNIAPFFTSDRTTCLETDIEDTHALFSQSISYSRENGFSIGAASVVGPKAHQLGISGNSSFTIITTIRFSAFDTNKKNNAKPYDFLSIPANTRNNNGINLEFTSQITQIGSSYGTNIELTYGTQKIQAIDPSTNTKLIMINPSFVYFLVLVKDNLDISLSLYPNIDNLSMNTQSGIRIVKSWKIDPSEDVLFSNKELIINRNKNIYGNLYNFGIYNRAIDDNTISTIFLHTQTEIHKTNQILSNLAEQINKLQEDLDKAKACPYDESVCKACSNINDWTNSGNIIMNGTNNCHTEIDKFCSKNPKNSLCVCWDPNNNMSHTQECKYYVNIFKKVKPLETDIEKLKETHNLCPCTTTLKMGGSLEVQDQLESQIKGTSNNKDDVPERHQVIIDDKYSVNQDDIAIYESYEVTNYYKDLDREIGMVYGETIDTY